ncbi:hypothetical protein E3N88_12164 [Mikania micrantha]|uniref:Uncharacterized protein n=1 Tax=Mikania micrantha TaxID=192012 RepID=A0A5N6P7P9_9ASTR|nr:hypothetical protein E3N88_12164 [Mikania micrantha]
MFKPSSRYTGGRRGPCQPSLQTTACHRVKPPPRFYYFDSPESKAPSESMAWEEIAVTVLNMKENAREPPEQGCGEVVVAAERWWSARRAADYISRETEGLMERKLGFERERERERVSC